MNPGLQVRGKAGVNCARLTGSLTRVNKYRLRSYTAWKIIGEVKCDCFNRVSLSLHSYNCVTIYGSLLSGLAFRISRSALVEDEQRAQKSLVLQWPSCVS